MPKLNAFFNGETNVCFKTCKTEYQDVIFRIRNPFLRTYGFSAFTGIPDICYLSLQIIPSKCDLKVLLTNFIFNSTIKVNLLSH